jgi:hypothetical protein
MLDLQAAAVPALAALVGQLDGDAVVDRGMELADRLGLLPDLFECPPGVYFFHR